MKLVWLDLETTGLNPKVDSILAIGMVITDEKLAVLGTFERFVHLRSLADLPAESGTAFEMHKASGLLELCAKAPKWLTWAAVRVLAFDFLEQHLGSEVGYLAGSSVHFDRSFLAERMPELIEKVSHRHLDVSAFKVLATALYPESAADVSAALGRPRHLPTADIQHSLKELQAWSRLLFNAPTVVKLAGAR